MSTSGPIQRLPLRLHPLHGEALLGFLLRLAAANGISCPMLLTQIAQAQFCCPQSAATTATELEKLSTVTGVTTEELYPLVYWARPSNTFAFNETLLPKQLLRLNPRCVCPRCLAENAVHKRAWDLTMTVACVSHRCLLLDRCQRCGSRLNWRSMDVTLCQCGASLTCMATIGLGDDELVGPCLVETLLSDQTLTDQAVPELFRHASLADALQLINFIGYFRHNSCAPTDPLYLKSNNRAALKRLNDGAKLCVNGLPAVQTFVDEISTHRTSLHRQVRPTLVADRFNRWIRQHTKLDIAVTAPAGRSVL